MTAKLERSISGLRGAMLANVGLVLLYALMFLATEDRWWMIMMAFSGAVVTGCAIAIRRLR